MAINTEELKLLIENIIPSNIKDNHIFFKKIFDVFFDYISDTYKLGSDSHLLLETDKALWNSDYSQLKNVDLSGIKKELIKTYLHDYNIFFDKLENDDDIHKYINTLYKELGIDRKFDATNLIDVINEEEFLIHKKFAQQKTIPLLFNYIDDLITKTGVGQFNEEDPHFRMYEGTNYNPRRAFAYTVDTSLFKPIYMSAIKPITHPLGFSFNYYKQIALEQTDNFNIDTTIEDYKVYVMQGDLEINAYMPPLNKMPKDCSFNPTKAVPQFVVPVVNTLSEYGTSKTTIAGNSFIRTSDNKYKLVSDGLEQFEGDINNCTLLDWNIDTNSYVLHKSEDTDEDIRKDLYGAMVNYNDIDLSFVDISKFDNISALKGQIGELMVNGDDIDGKIYNGVALDAFYDIQNRQVWVRKWDIVKGDYYWDRSRYLGMNRDFITFKSNESMYSLEALKFYNHNDNIRIYSLDSDLVFNPFGGCITFFVTLLDTDDTHYIMSATKQNSTNITHSILIEPDGIYVTELNGINTKGFFDFEANRRYQITFNWDANGRKIYVDGNELFLQDDNKTYNEKFYITDINTSSFTINDYVSIDIPFTRKSLSYQELNSYLETITLDLKVDYKKGSTILFENLSTKELTQIDMMLDDAIASAQREIVTVQNQLLRVSSLSKDSMYITSETIRINNLIAQTQDYIRNIKKISIAVGSLNLQLSDLIVENDEGRIKNMFDAIEDKTVMYEYSIPTSNAGFQYYTEINEITIGTPLYYAEQSISKANYILDNFDIVNRPMILPEILEMKKDHDLYIKSDEFIKSGLELLFSQDRKIFEHYHNEMETIDHCFTPWYIGETYSIGLDNNLLLMYYNNIQNCGMIFNTKDCAFGDYLDHPKSKVDTALEFSSNTKVYDNVLSVVELEENGKPKLIAYLNNNSRIEYVKGLYWKHYNNENGTLIEEKTKNTIMDYSYQIRVIGSKTNDGTRVEFDGTTNKYIDYDKSKEFFKLDSQLGEVHATKFEQNNLFKALVKDNKVRKYYTSIEKYNEMVDILKENNYIKEVSGVLVKSDRTPLELCTKNNKLDDMLYNWDYMVKDETNDLYSRLDIYLDTLIYKWEDVNFKNTDELLFSFNPTVTDFFYKESIFIDENENIDDNGLISEFMTDGFGIQLIKDGIECLSIDIDEEVVTYTPYTSKIEDFYNSCGSITPDKFITFDYPTMDMTFTQRDLTVLTTIPNVDWTPTITGTPVKESLVSIPTPLSCNTTDTEKVFVQSDYWTKYKDDKIKPTHISPTINGSILGTTTSTKIIQY